VTWWPTSPASCSRRLYRTLRHGLVVERVVREGPDVVSVRTRVIAEGPFGRLHSGVRTCRKVTLFAAGIGITPMRALLEELDFAPGDVTLIYRATDERELVLDREIDALAERKGAGVHYLIGPRRRSRRRGSWLPQTAGTLNDVEGLLRLVRDIGEHDVYLCGPDAWLDSVVHALRRAAVPPERIHLERFSW
jgi:ferredoxin-NADP reductase